MKRAIAMAMLALLIISACGCADGETAEISNNGRVQVIETGATHVIYVDTLTGVQYLRVYGGGVCVMVDADGKPLT
jgi:hypothetical protein